MITPLDIETKDFAKSMRGYNPDEVDDFLDRIIVDMEALLKERESMMNEREILRQRVEDLEKEVNELNSEIGEHKKTEESVMNTLDSAKVLMQDISVSAEKRADIIIRNAKLDAELIMKDAKEAIQHMGEECSELRAKSKAFRKRYRDMLEEELQRMDETEIDLFSDFDQNFDFKTDITFDESDEGSKDISAESDDEVLSLEDLIEDLSPIKGEETEDENSGQGSDLDRHTKLMSELNSVFDGEAPERPHNIPAPKATVALNSSDIDELLKKEEEQRKGADKNTVVI